jgi:hypothetical protein
MARSAENSAGDALAGSGSGALTAQSASTDSRTMKAHARTDESIEPAAGLGSDREVTVRVLIGTV